SDEYFAHRLREAGNVILAADRGVLPQGLFRTNALAVGDISAEKDRDGILRRARAFHIYRKWHPAFQQVEDDRHYGVNLQDATITPSAIFLHRPQMEDPNDRIIRIPLDKNGNFDVADFWGTKLPPRMPRFDKPFTDQVIWHMGIVLAAEALHLNLANADIELNKGRITLTGPNGIKRIIPVDSDGYFYVNWCVSMNDKRLTQEPIENFLGRDQARLTGDTNRYSQYIERKQDWRDKLVLVGSTAVGNDLSDRGATPLAKDTFLMSEHWNVANSILTGNFVRRSSMFMDLFLIIVMGAIATFITWACRSWTASVWVACVSLAYVTFSVVIFVVFRYWMPIVMPLAGGLLITHGCLLGYLVIFEQAEKRRVRSVFNKVMAPDVVAELLNTEKLSLSGARRKVTIFFCDIRGFTEMTDISREGAADYIKQHNLTGEQAEAIFDQQAKETLDTVNQYLKLIADVVRKNGGTVDKFIGDCVMAFWGAPIHNMHHAICCVRAAIETQRAVYRFNEERKAENRQREAKNITLAAEGKPLLSMLPILVVGTGINTGVVTVGLMGSDDQLNYTVFGRDVNLASRLEGVSGRSRIIISEATLAEIIQDDATLALSCKTLDPVPIKGIREPVPVFEVPWREIGTDDTTILRPAGESYNTGYFTAGERTME
ncbi:MAG TPA: adenylate/guanylate cyclase domain-containing protein, partial [Verrucomicrobiae bacterium]|nr:adenylate/guanylate cyclase domain-containing protein [Verrucomicrobiae bacterium]